MGDPQRFAPEGITHQLCRHRCGCGAPAGDRFAVSGRMSGSSDDWSWLCCETLFPHATPVSSALTLAVEFLCRSPIDPPQSGQTQFRMPETISSLEWKARTPSAHRLNHGVATVGLLSASVNLKAWLQNTSRTPMALPNPSAAATHGIAQPELAQQCLTNSA